MKGSVGLLELAAGPGVRPKRSGHRPEPAPKWRVGEQVGMSSIGRRQAGADQENFDLSKKTIRDVAAELARRSQPVVVGSQQSVTQPSSADPGQAAADNPPHTGGPGAVSSNLIQMDPRPGMSQPGISPSEAKSAAEMNSGAANPADLDPTMPSSLWVQHHPFADDPTGPTPLEALSRALDHKLFEPENITLTPSSMMTTDLGPPPLVVAPSAAHPTVDSIELPLQESVKSPPRDDSAPRPGIRHYPSPRFTLLRQLRTAWQRQGLRFFRKFASEPMQRGGMDWSTLVLGVGIGLIAGLGVVVLMSPHRPSGQPDLQQLATPSTSMPAAAPDTVPLLPVTPSAVKPAAVTPSTNAAAMPPTIVAVSMPYRPRDMTASTFGIPVALQPGKSPISGNGPMPTPPSDGMKANAGTAAGTAGAMGPTTTTPKPVKATAKANTKPVKKSSAGQHAQPNSSEQLSPAKR